jgi:hypothetical protein
MGSTPRRKSPERGGRTLLATQSLKTENIDGQRRAAFLYDVPRTTLRCCTEHVPTIQDFNAGKRKLFLSEGKSLLSWILELD